MCKLFLILFLIPVVSCNRYNAQWAPDHYWAAKQWDLVEMKNSSPEKNNVVLLFDWAGKRFKGSCGCNEIDGRYELIDKKNIKFASLTSNKNCQSGDIEKELIKTLGEIDSYELEGDKLLLKSNKKVMLVFTGKDTVTTAKRK